MYHDDETRAQLEAEMAGVNITVSLTGEEVLSLVAMAQLAYLTNPALGNLGECGKAAAQKNQNELEPNSLLAQHLSEDWVSKDFAFEPVNYYDSVSLEGFGPETFDLQT